MRFLTCATLSLLALSLPSLASADIIEVRPSKPKVKKKAPPKEEAPKESSDEEKAAAEEEKLKNTHFEMRVQLGDNQYSRDLSPLIRNRLKAYGYELSPSTIYGDISLKRPEGPAPVYDNTMTFEVVKSETTCFVVAKVSGDNMREVSWRWETKDDGHLPCEYQVQQAMKDYAWKNPPKNPAKDFRALEEGYEAEIAKLEEARAAKIAAEKAESEAKAAKRKQEAEEFRARQAEAERRLTEQENLDDFGKSGGLGCSATAGASASMVSGLLAMMAFPLRRRRH